MSKVFRFVSVGEEETAIHFISLSIFKFVKFVIERRLERMLQCLSLKLSSSSSPSSAAAAAPSGNTHSHPPPPSQGIGLGLAQFLTIW